MTTTTGQSANIVSGAHVQGHELCEGGRAPYASPQLQMLGRVCDVTDSATGTVTELHPRDPNGNVHRA